MKKHLTIVASVAAVAAVAGVAPAQASHTVTCSFSAELAYGAAEFSTGDGAANCVGEAEGRTVIGAGSLELAGSAPDGAGSGSGSGTIEIKVPYLLAIFDPNPYAILQGQFDYLQVGPAWEATGTIAGSDHDAHLAIAALERIGGSTGETSTISGRILLGGAAAESSRGDGPCTNSVQGTRKADRISGSDGDDLLSGFAGNDRLQGMPGADCLFGGSGRDRLDGGSGADAIHCGSGIDVVRADRDDDVAKSCERVRRPNA